MMTPTLFMLPSLRHLGQDPAYLANPSPFFRLLRQRRVCLDRELGALILSRYEDVQYVLSSPTFSASLRRPVRQTAPLQAPRVETWPGIQQPGVLLDSAHCLRLRAILRGALSPATLQRQRVQQGIEHVCQVLLDRIVVQGAGGFDLISDLAAPLSLHVLMALMGLPTHQVHLARFVYWMEALGTVSDQFNESLPSQDVAECLAEMQAFFQRLLETSAPPPGTVIGSLAAALDAGQTDFGDLLAVCWLWLAAGHRYTVSAVANCLRALLRHPEQLHLVRRSPGLITQTVEEGLRYDPPVQWVERSTRVESEIAGVTFRAGQRVVLGLAAANRDMTPVDRVASHPDMFDVQRVPGHHLSFGYGPHFCLGFRLARLQIATVLRLVLSRFSHVELVGDGVRLAGSNRRVWGMQECPVHFSPSSFCAVTTRNH